MFILLMPKYILIGNMRCWTPCKIHINVEYNNGRIMMGISYSSNYSLIILSLYFFFWIFYNSEKPQKRRNMKRIYPSKASCVIIHNWNMHVLCWTLCFFFLELAAYYYYYINEKFNLNMYLSIFYFTITFLWSASLSPSTMCQCVSWWKLPCASRKYHLWGSYALFMIIRKFL